MIARVQLVACSTVSSVSKHRQTAFKVTTQMANCAQIDWRVNKCMMTPAIRLALLCVAIATALLCVDPITFTFCECMQIAFSSRQAVLRGVYRSLSTSRTSSISSGPSLVSRGCARSQTPISSQLRHFCSNRSILLQSKRSSTMSASNEPQSTEKVAQVSQDAIPAAQGEGSAGSSKEVPATLNEAGTLAADGDKSAREGRSHIQDHIKSLLC